MSVLVDTSVWIEYQYKCLKNGLNGIGIPDLIIAQNAKLNHCEIYSLDNHFSLNTKEYKNYGKSQNK